MVVFTAPFRAGRERGIDWQPPEGASCLADIRAPGSDGSGPAVFKGDTLPAGATEITGDSALLALLFDRFVIHADVDGITAPFPLSLTRKGLIQIAWPDGSVRSRAFAKGLDALWPKMQERLRRQYRSLHSKDQTLARKWLSVQMKKTGIAQTRQFIPDDMDDVKPIRPSTYLRDDFNRSNEDLESGNWTLSTTSPGSPVVLSNQVADDSADVARVFYDTVLSSDDQRASIDVIALATPSGGRTFVTGTCRLSDDGANVEYYEAQITRDNAGAYNVRLVKNDTGGFTVLSDDSPGVSLPDTVTTDCNGSTIRSLLNGTQIASVTDSAVTGNLDVGLTIRSTNAAAGSSIGDNWVATDLYHMPLMAMHYRKQRGAA